MLAKEPKDPSPGETPNTLGFALPELVTARLENSYFGNEPASPSRLVRAGCADLGPFPVPDHWRAPPPTLVTVFSAPFILGLPSGGVMMTLGELDEMQLQAIRDAAKPHESPRVLDAVAWLSFC